MARVVIVGAGLSGLCAATRLRDLGHQVTVLDKGRGVGGRLATRRMDTPDGAVAIIDHGAQFFTVRSDEFRAAVQSWIDDGIVREWCRGFDRHDGHPRYVVNGGMTMLAKHLAAGRAPLDVRTSTLVFEIRPGTSCDWTVVIDDGSTIDCDAVITTCPLLQSYSITVTAGAELPGDLLRSDYDRTIGLLAVLDGPPNIPAPGGLQNPDALFSWIGDNQAKGVSPIPAVTFHAGPAWSAEHWDDDPAVGRAALIEAARPYLGTATIVVADYKKWRFATPRAPWPDPYLVSPVEPGTLVFAGDAFAGPKVEGAFLSGSAAAGHLASVLAR
ncbi:MAG: NAD(P)/FAD-dependent oxidoreductase [Ilumatobacteraceae bacterium]